MTFHPDRDGCDCEKQGLMDQEECVHPDPCWVSREAYEQSQKPPSLLAEARGFVAAAVENGSTGAVRENARKLLSRIDAELAS